MQWNKTEGSTELSAKAGEMIVKTKTRPRITARYFFILFLCKCGEPAKLESLLYYRLWLDAILMVGGEKKGAWLVFVGSLS